ncbi:MAG TPA: pitrilysin family protein, partial [Fodinibius sp.]|nr:pitrilysin family protein [Fodinibius sp.]
MKRLSILCLIIFVSASLAQAQQQYDELEYPELNEFQKPDIETFTTDNGIKFFLVEDHELPLIDLSVRIRTGGVQVPNKEASLASITGTVMRSGGTQSYPADTLNKILENNAASMETGISFTSGYAGMNVLKEDFDEMLPLFIDLLTNPAFPKEKIALAKKQQKSAISRRNDNAGPIASREFDKLIYGDDSKYSRFVEYATVNDVTREDIVNFHKENFSGRNMMIGLVGDFDTNTMKEKLRSAFNSIPAGEETDFSFPEVDYDYKSSINFVDKSDINQSTVLLGHIGDMRDNPDYAEVQVMNNVLSGGFSGRLFQKVRSDLGLAYSVGGQYGMGNTFYPGQFYVQVKTKSASTAEAINAIIKEIERLQNEPIGQDELQDTKDQFLNSLVFRNTSYEQILNRRISNEYRGLPADAFEQFIEGIKSTTVEDVQKMAQKYLHPDKLQILVVGNKDELGNQLQQFGDVNTIDISIPQPGDNAAEEAVKGDAQKGKQLLSQMANAVIAEGTELNTLSLKGTVKQGGREIGTTMTIDYPDAIEQTVQSPMGEVKLSYKGGSGTMNAGGQERPLPPAMAKGLKSTLNKSYLAIAMKANELNPQFLGTEEVDGTSYNKVSVNVDDSNITLLLDQDTNYPEIQRYKQFNPQMGEQVEV